MVNQGGLVVGLLDEKTKTFRGLGGAIAISCTRAQISRRGLEGREVTIAFSGFAAGLARFKPSFWHTKQLGRSGIPPDAKSCKGQGYTGLRVGKTGFLLEFGSALEIRRR